MVVINSYLELENLCFSDFDVLGIKVDEKSRVFEIKMEGVWLIENDNARELCSGIISITNYQKLLKNFDNTVLGTRGDASVDQIKEIKEINEHQVSKDSFSFCGFSDDGSWVEVKIIGGKITCKFLEYI